MMLSNPHIPLERDQFIISFTFALRRVLFRIKCKRAPHKSGLPRYLKSYVNTNVIDVKTSRNPERAYGL